MKCGVWQERHQLHVLPLYQLVTMLNVDKETKTRQCDIFFA